LVKDVVDTRLVSKCQDDNAVNGVAKAHVSQYDVVVDATGSPAGLSLAARLCRPMGTLVLKSTCASGEIFQAAPFVIIDELKVVGR
jgi:threonine dehydrogenase-like Zn-dependent dehydrogenase